MRRGNRSCACWIMIMMLAFSPHLPACSCLRPVAFISSPGRNMFSGGTGLWAQRKTAARNSVPARLLHGKSPGTGARRSVMNRDSDSRTIVVGDVHGCRQELEDMLTKTQFDKRKDQLVFVGDLVAKGPDSIGCLQLALECDAIATMGNHEAKVLRDGASTSGSGSAWPAESDAEGHTKNEYLIVHAGLVPGIRPEDNEIADLLHMRNVIEAPSGSLKASAQAREGEAWAKRWKGPEFVIFGHDAKRGLQQEPHALGLDTGCVYGGSLSAVLLPERHVVSVPARAQYAPIVEKSK